MLAQWNMQKQFSNVNNNIWIHFYENNFFIKQMDVCIIFHNLEVL